MYTKSKLLEKKFKGFKRVKFVSSINNNTPFNVDQLINFATMNKRKGIPLKNLIDYNQPISYEKEKSINSDEIIIKHEQAVSIQIYDMVKNIKEKNMSKHFKGATTFKNAKNRQIKKFIKDYDNGIRELILYVNTHDINPIIEVKMIYGGLPGTWSIETKIRTSNSFYDNLALIN